MGQKQVKLLLTHVIRGYGKIWQGAQLDKMYTEIKSTTENIDQPVDLDSSVGKGRNR